MEACDFSAIDSKLIHPDIGLTCPWLIAWEFVTQGRMRQVPMHEDVWARPIADDMHRLQCWKLHLGKIKEREQERERREQEREWEREQERGNSPVARQEEQWWVPRMSGERAVEALSSAARNNIRDGDGDDDNFNHAFPLALCTFNQKPLKLPIPCFCLWSY